MYCDMIKTNISELLASREKSLYWLSKRTGISYPALVKLRDSQTDSISFRVLESICIALECEPGAVLVRVVDQPKRGAKKKGAKKKGAKKKGNK
jgi:putative transcriptional regulator